ncbi:MAG: hypothetical protein IJS32_07400 [Kiritimatiellae bacterium]|nr:hypothetical protein [Kiritimatiellia bacterium]
MIPEPFDAVSHFRRRFRIQRMRDRLRHVSEPFIVVGVHLLAALLVAIAAGRAVREPPVETIEIAVAEAPELELDPPEDTPLDDLADPDEVFDFSIPSPEAIAEEAPPAVEDFSALPPVESPVVLSGFP